MRFGPHRGTVGTVASAVQSPRLVLDEEYGDLDPNEVIPDLVNQMLAQSESDSVWLGRSAALGCIVEGVIQAEAAEQARNN